jgi:hypothetical protein
MACLPWAGQAGLGITSKTQALKVISFYFIVFKSQVLNRFAQDIEDIGGSENNHPKRPPIP